MIYHPTCKCLLRLIDISKHQGEIDYDVLVSDSGVAGAYIKTSEGTDYVDPMAGVHFEELTKRGFPVGPYHFATPGTDGEHNYNDSLDEAEFFHAINESLGRWTLPAMLDIERYKHLKNTQMHLKRRMRKLLSALSLSAWTASFLNQYEELASLKPGTMPIYASLYYFTSKLSPMYGLPDHPLWVAKHAKNPPKLPVVWGDWVLWQYTSDGSVPGVEGDVDLNRGTDFWSIYIKE